MTVEKLADIKKAFDAACNDLANDPYVRSSVASELQSCFDAVWSELLRMRAVAYDRPDCGGDPLVKLLAMPPLETVGKVVERLYVRER